MRNKTIQHYQQNPDVSVLIIGGGVNGIGVFRDLALQGVDVLLVDKGDFCSGASAASSHMAHGGIRYLENGEFRLVREAVQERNRLLVNAPHYVKPLPTTIPIFKYFSGLLNAPLKFFNLLDRPSERGAIVIKIGLMLYDAYTGAQRTVPRHTFTPRNDSLTRYPSLNPEVLFTAQYFDGAILNPERLCIEMILDAEAGNENAHALNYVSAAGSNGNRVTLRDETSNQTFEVQPRLVINAAGPWIDFANEALGEKTKFIGGTKGSHLILDHPELRAAIGETEFFFENNDGRIVLIYPYYDKVMIGTSDLPVEDPDDVHCTDEEIDYFFGMVRKVFPKIKLSHDQIVFAFSGVRPLPAQDAATPGQISRDHSTRVLEPDGKRSFPVFSLVGGKWTTFRAFGEGVTDRALAHLGVTRQASTRDLPIGGGRGYPETDSARKESLSLLSKERGLPLERVSTLFERYGTYSEKIIAYMLESPDQPLQNHPGYTRREIEFLAKNEKVVHLDDLLLRRTLLKMLGESSPALEMEISSIINS